MSLANYTSYYEIFAGLSAALVGIDFIKDYFISKVKTKHDELKLSFDEAKEEYSSDLKFVELIKDNEAISNNFKAWINRLYKVRYTAYDWCIKNNDKFLLDRELQIITNKTPRISIFVFLYTLSVIIIIGLGQDTTLIAPSAVVGTLTLVSFVLVYRMSFFICKDGTYKMRYTISWFFIGLFASIIHYLFFARNNHWFCIHTPDNIILIGSLLFCIYGLYLMFSRSLAWLLIKHPVYRLVLSILISKQATKSLEDKY